MSWIPSYKKPAEPPQPLEIVTWSEGTDEQIAAMLEAHYAGEIDVTEYWAVGDKRSIHINAMSATENISEAHHADDYEYVIIGLNHDDLVTPVGEITTAAITIQQDRLFFTDTSTVEYGFNDTYWDEAHEFGYMGTGNDQYNTYGWKESPRRTWCNETYFNALPQYIQDNIKQVYKSTADSGYTSYPTWIANTDKCFLLSEREVFGTNTYSAENGNYYTHYINRTSGGTISTYCGGKKYSYFNTSINTYKLPRFTSGYPSGVWRLRSPNKGENRNYCVVYREGDSNIATSDQTLGIAPAFCL